MATLKAYSIIEFSDGLAIVPSHWLNNDETKCTYPNFRDPAKIKKAVASQQLPEDNPNWKMYDVLRIFYKTNSYQRAKDKLLIAEKMSDLATNESSEDETKRCDKEKKSRHMRAKKNNSSSEECDGFDSDTSQELTKLSSFPKVPDKLNITKKKIPASQKIVPPPLSSNVERSKSECQKSHAIHTKSLHQEETINKYTKGKYVDNSSDENNNLQNLKTAKQMSTKSKNLITEKNEFQIEVIRKLQLILNRITALENRMVLLQASNIVPQEAANVIEYEEYDLPLKNMQTLIRLENQLKDSSFADKMVNTLKQVGGVNLSNIISNILKKLLSDDLAQSFSYLGQRNKRNFSALKLCSIMKRVVRIQKPDSNDAQIAEITSSWLVHAKWRQQRAETKMRKQREADNINEADDVNEADNVNEEDARYPL
ncbi:uncharacterized protein LOC114255293 isoform X2 [Monomorium pharaonis]|uniref:uncharacterized protein LOC114255293 isoform X2 n=1 Tax=Monomorium pharaonis TaxID=307658 RepID=UPI001746D9C4|nr:uncharacterized protein LOC114255293 isoform X2 [Monomorium pharaonis]XP_036138288.1 uncharacterized protein LOC114255293 isoform X2 [Monomorium pharaonis]XP_036138289.1 uncharacterized protein LOC114255293 isoform X2 [Monomorium pharaonis]